MRRSRTTEAISAADRRTALREDSIVPRYGMRTAIIVGTQAIDHAGHPWVNSAVLGQRVVSEGSAKSTNVLIIAKLMTMVTRNWMRAQTILQSTNNCSTTLPRAALR